MNGKARRRLLIVSVLSVVVLMAALAAPAAAAEGNVLPPTARVAGWSLTQAAQRTAFFNTSIIDWNTYYRDESRLPEDLPFQILYLRPGNSFEAKPGTTFYLPIVFIDTSPEVLGTYPTTNAEARKYFFGQDQFGIRNVQVTIDGETINIGEEYLAGPVATKLGYSYVDSTETFQYAAVAVFLKLQKGEHTVTIYNEAAGTLLLDYLEKNGSPREPMVTEITYNVTVR